MKRIFTISVSITLIVALLYFIGPKPALPTFETPTINLPSSLIDLEEEIDKSERATKGLKPDNEARIIWADSTHKEKTKIAILYIHGFTGSPEGGAPIHQEMAKKLGANLYLFRNAHHGIDLGDSTMVEAKADDYIYAAEKALVIAKKLGDEVIVMGTSLGGALTLYLASRHPEIKSIVVYSPAIRMVQLGTELAIKPWGLQLSKLMRGSAYIDMTGTNQLSRKYFSTHVHLNGAIASLNFIFNAMNSENFEKIRCPVLLCYWYKNEDVQDDQTSVKAMLEMYDQISTPPQLKRKHAFPNAGNHAIGCYITSQDYPAVEVEVEKFLNEIVLK